MSERRGERPRPRCATCARCHERHQGHVEENWSRSTMSGAPLALRNLHRQAHRRRRGHCSPTEKRSCRCDVRPASSSPPGTSRSPWTVTALGGGARSHAHPPDTAPAHAGGACVSRMHCAAAWRPCAFAFSSENWGAAGAGGRQLMILFLAALERESRGLHAKGGAAALHRGAPRFAGAAAGTLRGRASTHRRQRRLNLPCAVSYGDAGNISGNSEAAKDAQAVRYA